MTAFPKTAPVRLKGKALTKLREDCLERDGNLCQDCGQGVDDAVPKWHPLKPHMAHTKGRGANGADELSNVRTLCGSCHVKSHNSGGKPCPPKPTLHSPKESKS